MYTLGLLCSLIATICTALEAFLTKNTKEQWTKYIRAYSRRIRNVSIPDIHKRTTFHIDKTFHEFWSNGNRFVLFLIAATFSIGLTLIAIVIGHNMDKLYPEYALGLAELKSENKLTYTLITAIILNLICDLFSFNITRNHIALIKNSHGLKFPYLLFRDLLFSFLIALMLIVLTYYGSIVIDSDMSLDFGEVGSLDSVILTCISGIRCTLSPTCSGLTWIGDTWIPYSYFTFSITAFVPTLLLALFIMSTYLAYYMLLGYVKFLKRYVRKVFEDDKVFSPIAAIFAVLAAFTFLLSHLIGLIGS